ncbi:uncharacterized protein LOC129575412 [Sitodiplosis mosellana]|uniref:uncharacterized protein LOC129575412 n=1 Tax=Sitodiplosis mosellana TaxID=263140 RepID=UPI00244390CE|nr:uncharacterized protein LOC129575412 [Sitodiplosis mosellana]XP_055314984.1 uncharacterized protein LOC129575412 [Sitodiplosis mosellana]
MMGFRNIQIVCFLFLMFLGTQINGERPMYVLCPPAFIPVGNICYFISKERVNWLDAHFECKERNSRLAEPSRKEDRLLRKHLNKLSGLNLGEMWIGARFNWERNKWQWGYNGDDLTYQSFSQMSADNKDLKFHCAILKPKLKYRWSASSCEQQLQFLCQHKVKFANEKKRKEIHNKWNETYPNQMANEVLHVVSQNDLFMFKSRRHGLNSRSNSRQTKDELNHRQKNGINPKDFAYQKPNRKTPKSRSNRKFDLNRYRAQGIRQTIHFNSTWQQNNYNRQWRQKQRMNLPTTRESTSTILPNTTMTTTTRTTTTISNDVNHHDGRYTANYNHKKLKPEYEHKSNSNILNTTTYHTGQSKQTDQTEVVRQRTEQATNQLAIQTNEILDNVLTTLSPKEVKKRKLKSLRNQLSKLSPEAQELFFKRRAERNKKRGIAE